MENVYLNNVSLSWKRFIKYCTLVSLLGIAFIFTEALGIIQVDSKILYDDLLTGLSIFILIQGMNPKINKCIIDEIKFRSDSIALVIIPILVAALKRVLNNILQVIPTLFGGNVIGVAKGQLDISTYTQIDKIVVAAIVGPFLEEFIFRIVFFTFIAYIAGYIDYRFGKKLLNRIFNFRSIFCWILIIVNGTIFSLIHLPNMSNFHLYFIGGVVYSIIYIKYGFYASWLCHGFYNYFSFSFIFSLFGIN